MLANKGGYLLKSLDSRRTQSHDGINKIGTFYFEDSKFMQNCGYYVDEPRAWDLVC